MGKFYGGGTVFPFGAFGQTQHDPGQLATVPVINQAAVVPPQAMPAGPIMPARPQGFPALLIRPEVLGPPPQKQVVPPLFDARTRASFTRGQFVDVLPPGLSPMRPVATPEVSVASKPHGAPGNFTPSTKVNVAVERAAREDYRATNARRKALELQRRADALAHAASKADSKVRVDPSPAARGDAEAKSKEAELAQDQADQAAKDAAKKEAAATDAGIKASQVTQEELDAAAAWSASYQGSVESADSSAMTGGNYIWPDGSTGQIPGADGLPNIPGVGGGGYLVPVGGGAAAGFFVGGPIGALIGALLGGGYVYVKNR